uniref:Si:dkey-2n12.1 protein (inferred by orthology to a zebrafish protein) n=1 Tax=Strongyloides venezuelensis TaxID=75913 RepID=A0A0K0FD04_STRVS
MFFLTVYPREYISHREVIFDVTKIQINILLSQKPPTSHAKNRKYVRVDQYLISPWEKQDLVNGKFPPELPPKRNKYMREGPCKVVRVHYKVYKVKLYHGTVQSILFKCNGNFFPNKILADKYCETLNKHWKAKCNRSYLRQTSRNSLIRSNSDLTDRRNSISETSGFSRGRNSISGSLKRLSKSRRDFSPGKRRSSLSESEKDSLSKSLETLHISKD